MPGTRDDSCAPEWFQQMFGFKERDYEETKEYLDMVGECLRSKKNGREYHVGNFEALSLETLRFKCERACACDKNDKFWSCGSLSFQNMVSCTRKLHLDPSNKDAIFQVMSLYNCLETLQIGLGPEAGVTDYANRPCQGPAAAMSCPAATVFRNYCLPEIDCFEKLSQYVNNQDEKYWKVTRGLCMPISDSKLHRLSTRIAKDSEFSGKVQEQLQVGVHWSTEVVGGSHDVCQVICSAMPISMMKMRPANDWEGFASAVLEAAFDATLTVATLRAAARGCRTKVYLTALGGGELGNRQKWIYEALSRALHTHEKEPLDVTLVHYDHVPTQYAMLEEGRLPGDGLSGAKLGQRQQVTSLKMSSTYVEMEAQAACVGGVDALTDAFAHFDTNGDGVLDKVEMMRILQQADPDFFTEHVVNILFREADCDGDGQIHYSEFVNWMCSEDEEITSAILEHCAHNPSSTKNPSVVFGTEPSVMSQKLQVCKT